MWIVSKSARIISFLADRPTMYPYTGHSTAAIAQTTIAAVEYLPATRQANGNTTRAALM
jgi:hypothetical protein